MWRQFEPRTVVVVAALLVVLAAFVGFAATEVDDPSRESPADQPQTDTATATNSEAQGESTLKPRFREVSDQAGFNYTADTIPSMIVNGGVYVLDFNGDQWPDLLAVGGAEPAVFRNSGGKFNRTEVLPPINATVEGAHVFDFDNDGREDILLLAQNHRPILLENEGGRFVERPGAFPVNMTYPIGATTADYDGDGCLDVFVFQYADWANKQPAGVKNMTVSGSQDNGNPNYLFRGNCTAQFSSVTSGAFSDSRWTLAASFVDLTGDDRPDIHVANDFNYDILYVNRGNGTFEQTRLGNETNRNAMASEVADVNGDGRPDVFVTNIYLPEVLRQTSDEFSGRMEGHNLLLNRGDGAFEDAAKSYGVLRGGWGWAAALADFDNDGNRELFHTTKRIHLSPIVQSKIVQEGLTVDLFYERNPSIKYPQYYERTDDGFLAMPAASMGFKNASGTGVARTDFDRDGDLDLAVAQVDGQFYLYENALAGNGTHWIQIDVRGDERIPVTGAEVTVTVNGQPKHRLVNSRADHLSQDSRTVHVGVGNTTQVDRIRVVWPDGSETILEDVAVDQRIVISPNGRENRTDG